MHLTPSFHLGLVPQSHRHVNIHTILSRNYATVIKFTCNHDCVLNASLKPLLFGEKDLPASRVFVHGTGTKRCVVVAPPRPGIDLLLLLVLPSLILLSADFRLMVFVGRSGDANLSLAMQFRLLASGQPTDAFPVSFPQYFSTWVEQRLELISPVHSPLQVVYLNARNVHFRFRVKGSPGTHAERSIFLRTEPATLLVPVPHVGAGVYERTLIITPQLKRVIAMTPVGPRQYVTMLAWEVQGVRTAKEVLDDRYVAALLKARNNPTYQPIESANHNPAYLQPVDMSEDD
jgi:hypothetical protein